MTRKSFYLLLFFLSAPLFVSAASGDIEASTKLKTLLTAGSQIVISVIILISVMKIGSNTALKSMSAEERSSAETKDLVTKLGTLGIGAVLVLAAGSIVEFVMSTVQ